MSRREERPASFRLFLLVVVSAIFVTTLTGSMVNVVIPLIKATFGVPAVQIGWIVTGFVLAFAVGVPLYGRISDLFGIRRVFVLGLLGFATGGLVCAVAPSFPVLVAGRILQGAGGAVVPALANVAVAKVLSPGQRGGALGLVASSVGIGSAVGPIVGGAVGSVLGWRALFVGSLLLTLLLIPFARRVLPDDGSGAARRFDLLGGILLCLAAGLFLFGVTQGQAAGFAAPSSWGSFLSASVAAVGFVRRIRTASHPFVSLTHFRHRAYVAAMVVAFLTMMVYVSVLVFVPLLVVEVNRLTPAAAGLVLTPGAAVLALLSPLTGRLSDVVGVRAPIVAGLTIMLLALIFISTFSGASPSFIAAGMAGVGAGLAFVQSPNNNAAANALPHEELGGGMGLLVGTFFLGGGAGPALVGAFLATRQEAASSALNPLYELDAAPFADAFLVLILPLIVALIAARFLKPVGRRRPSV